VQSHQHEQIRAIELLECAEAIVKLALVTVTNPSRDPARLIGNGMNSGTTDMENNFGFRTHRVREYRSASARVQSSAHEKPTDGDPWALQSM
jgi:hypothetical protein